MKDHIKIKIKRWNKFVNPQQEQISGHINFCHEYDL